MSVLGVQPKIQAETSQKTYACDVTTSLLVFPCTNRNIHKAWGWMGLGYSSCREKAFGGEREDS